MSLLCWAVPSCVVYKSFKKKKEERERERERRGR